MKSSSPLSFFFNLLHSNNLVWPEHKTYLKATARLPVDPCGTYGVNNYANQSTPRKRNPLMCRSVQYSFQSSNHLPAPAFAQNNYSLDTMLLTVSVTFLRTL